MHIHDVILQQLTDAGWEEEYRTGKSIFLRKDFKIGLVNIPLSDKMPKAIIRNIEAQVGFKFKGI